MKKTTSVAIGAAALMSAVSTEAAVVSWNVNVFGDSPTGATPTAGVVASSYWNDTFLDGLPNPANDLRDSTGAASTIDISWSSGAGSYAINFAHPGTDSDGTLNKEILNGYLNSGQNEAPNQSSVTLSQIGYSSYDIYVYFSADVADREGSVTDGTSTYYFRTLAGASTSGSNAVLTQTSDTVDDVQDGLANYAIFSDLSGTTQTLTVDIPNYGGIAAVQIVETVPEPSVSVLGALGVLCLLRRRRQ